jgi:hypothetical protein
MKHRKRLLAALPTGFLLASVLLFPACKMESGYDVYLEGLKIAGAAEKGPCALVWDKQEQAHVLNSSKIRECIDEVDRALVYYEKAVEMGHDGQDVQTNIADTKHKLDKLNSMLRTIKRIEVTQEIEAQQR